jgi:hypothetical protein
MLGGPDTMDDPGATCFVFQASEPSIEFLGALKGIHVRYCIQMDTDAQSCKASGREIGGNASGNRRHASGARRWHAIRGEVENL